jgi:hypothetical protein
MTCRALLSGRILWQPSLVTIISAAETAAPADIDDRRQPPVFVLTASRSGSTLLRFLLDSHPDLACPPESGIANACVALARSWAALENAGSGNRRKINDPVTLSPRAAMAIRQAIDLAHDHYLAHSGKRRWCDKSLESYQFAEVMAQVYPDAKFICLFRHCMDVVASGVESCPWGVSRFGFDPFVVQYPGNNVAAIGSYWLACAQAILAFEERHPEQCYRLRYEDLVTAPEKTAAEIFAFLGADQVPGISQACFRTPHEGDGPGDEKIWFTSEITTGSMGRGVAVPAAALPPPVRQAINEALATLGYRQVDDEWNNVLNPVDPRAYPDPPAGASGHAGHDGAQAMASNGQGAVERADAIVVAKAVAERLSRGGDARLREIGTRWPTVSDSVIRLVVQSANGYREEVQVDFGAAARSSGRTASGAIGTGGQGAAGSEPVNGEGEPAALIVAAPGTWRSLLAGNSNMATEVLTGRVRCINKRDMHRLRSDELHAVATLLGLASIPLARMREQLAGAADT